MASAWLPCLPAKRASGATRQVETQNPALLRPQGAFLVQRAKLAPLRAEWDRGRWRRLMRLTATSPPPSIPAARYRERIPPHTAQTPLKLGDGKAILVLDAKGERVYVVFEPEPKMEVPVGEVL
jgi:hypothetical protein